ncbi:MAG: hypothetical protein GY830_00530, partial [Bacteroidetes bacterium]|nr:hypothetical protein [Bacteroidota bacterium]
TKKASKEIIKLAKKKKIKAKITYKKDSFKVTKNVDLKGKLKKGKGGVVAAEENLVVGSDVVGRGKTVTDRVNKLKKIPKEYKNVPTRLRGKKPGTIDLSKFKRNQNGVLVNEKTGYKLVKEDSRNSGVGPHGGSYWKLCNNDKIPKRIGSITKEGVFLRK